MNNQPAPMSTGMKVFIGFLVMLGFGALFGSSDEPTSDYNPTRSDYGTTDYCYHVDAYDADMCFDTDGTVRVK